jgi:type IX secretion system PorP/SprF family membrane protein
MYPELAAGAVLHTRQAWVGMAAHHLTRPRQSFYEDALSSIPMRYTVHAGMRISLKGGNDYYPTNPFQAISVMPMIQYRMQEKFDQLDVGAQFRYAPLLLGVWYRGLPGIKSYEGLPNHDALAFLLGVELPSGLSVGYSYDVTVSTFANSVTYGAHEISVIYQWAMGDEAKHVRKRGVRFDVPFPKM